MRGPARSRTGPVSATNSVPRPGSSSSAPVGDVGHRREAQQRAGGLQPEGAQGGADARAASRASGRGSRDLGVRLPNACHVPDTRTRSIWHRGAWGLRRGLQLRRDAAGGGRAGRRRAAWRRRRRPDRAPPWPPRPATTRRCGRRWPRPACSRCALPDAVGGDGFGPVETGIVLHRGRAPDPARAGPGHARARAPRRSPASGRPSSSATCWPRSPTGACSRRRCATRPAPACTPTARR